MKNTKTAIAAISAAALLMTSCGAISTAGTESITATESAADNTDATTAATDITADAQTDASDTQTEATTATTVSTTEKTEETTVSTEPQKNEDTSDVTALVRSGSTSILNCTGTVTAVDGLNLRKEPSKESKRITLLKYNTKIKITGYTITGDPHHWEDRWFRVDYNGQTGYVLAHYVAAVCSTPPEKLSEGDRSVLGAALFYQGLNFYLDFQRGLNVLGATYTDDFDDQGYTKLEPAGLTIQKVETEFRKYFTDAVTCDFTQFFKEKDGSLWTMTGYGDNVSLKYQEISTMTAQEDKKLTFGTKSVFFKDPGGDMNEEIVENHPFTIEYTDGVWKIAEITCSE